MIRTTLKYGFLGALAIAAVTLAGPASVFGQTLDFGAVLTNYSSPDGGDIEQSDPRVLDLIEASNAAPPPSQETMDAIAAGGSAAEAAIRDYLTAGNPSPNEVSRRAVALSRAVALDPRLSEDDEALFDRSLLIADYASRTLCAPRLLRLDVDFDYRPPPGTFAFDFGGDGTPAAEQFAITTPRNGGLAGSEAVDMGREGALIRDMLSNVQRLEFDVPNGEYRVILITSAGLVGQAPFGTSLTVNGESSLLGIGGEGDWWNRARLRVPPDGGNGIPTMPEISGTGGAIVVLTQVVDGKLRIEFSGGTLRDGGVVSGILIEPAGEPSSLLLEGLARDITLTYDDCLGLELLTQTAMAQVLLNPALGPLGEPITRGDGLTDVDGPFDSEESGSPS